MKRLYGDESKSPNFNMNYSLNTTPSPCECRDVSKYRAGGKVFLSVFEKLKKIDSNDRKELKNWSVGKRERTTKN